MTTLRRQSLKCLGFGLALAGVPNLATAASNKARPTGALRSLDALTRHLATVPRRRDFKTTPMILDHRDQWDADALDAVLHYAGGPKQSWDNTDINGPWLNVMRNSMNSEYWSFRHPEFLCVSATHGTAQLALYDDKMWEKYGLAKLAGGNLTRNTFATGPSTEEIDRKIFQSPNGPFSSHNNNIPTLQQRGAVFLACHNAVWELSERLIAANVNPDKVEIDALSAELTNHMISGVVMTPGAVGTLVELSAAGFAYAR